MSDSIHTWEYRLVYFPKENATAIMEVNFVDGEPWNCLDAYLDCSSEIDHESSPQEVLANRLEAMLKAITKPTLNFPADFTGKNPLSY